MKGSTEPQTRDHPLVFADRFDRLADFGVFLMHKRDYEEAAALTRGSCVLDLGCNNGYGADILARGCSKVVAADVSEAALADAEARFDDRGIVFQVIDGRSLPFSDATFETVVSFQVIEHVDDVDTYLGEIRRVLKPDGRALLTTPNKRIRLDPGMTPWNRFHVQEFTHEELRWLLACYFKSVRVRGLFASERMYRMERKRYERSRALARNGIDARLKRLAKSILPDTLQSQIRRIVRGEARDRSYSEVKSKEYSTKEYFYRETDLDEALTLFAVCRKGS